MKTHELKTWPDPFQAVWEGRKTYELRVDDRGVDVGDKLHLREWQPEVGRLMQGEYTGRAAIVLVTYVTRGGEWRLPKELCVLGFRRLELHEPNQAGSTKRVSFPPVPGFPAMTPERS